jgi:hypothetical protein
MHTRMRYYGTIIVVALALLATILAQAGDKPAQTDTVLIKGFAFVPDHHALGLGCEAPGQIYR